MLEEKIINRRELHLISLDKSDPQRTTLRENNNAMRQDRLGLNIFCLPSQPEVFNLFENTSTVINHFIIGLQVMSDLINETGKPRHCAVLAEQTQVSGLIGDLIWI